MGRELLLAARHERECGCAAEHRECPWQVEPAPEAEAERKALRRAQVDSEVQRFRSRLTAARARERKRPSPKVELLDTGEITDPVSEAERPTRRALARLQRAVRQIQRPRVQGCQYARTGAASSVLVALRTDEHGGRARFVGLQNCGSVWECPCCSSTIKRRRADTVRKVVELAGGDCHAYLLTLTVRHGRNHELRPLWRKMCKAWSSFINGAPWRRFRDEHGLLGYVRGLEVTHGPKNGWHPHLHVMLLFDSNDAEAIERSARWMRERWIGLVSKHVGEAHKPSWRRAVTLTRSHRTDYVTKLGLEVTDPYGGKRGRDGNRTPLQIAVDFSQHKRLADAVLWQTYCQQMRGARQLTWSRGLRERWHINVLSDAELAAEPEQLTIEDTIALVVERQGWEAVRRKPGARVQLLELVEREGSDAGARFVEQLLKGPVERRDTTRRPQAAPPWRTLADLHVARLPSQLGACNQAVRLPDLR